MNENDKHISIWNHFLRIVEQIVEPQKYTTWFKPVRPVSMVDSTLTVEVPSDFFRNPTVFAQSVHVKPPAVPKTPRHSQRLLIFLLRRCPPLFELSCRLLKLRTN